MTTIQFRDLKQLSTRDKQHFVFELEYLWVQFSFIRIKCYFIEFDVKRIAVWTFSFIFSWIISLIDPNEIFHHWFDRWISIPLNALIENQLDFVCALTPNIVNHTANDPSLKNCRRFDISESVCKEISLRTRLNVNMRWKTFFWFHWKSSVWYFVSVQ